MFLVRRFVCAILLIVHVLFFLPFSNIDLYDPYSLNLQFLLILSLFVAIGANLTGLIKWEAAAFVVAALAISAQNVDGITLLTKTDSLGFIVKADWIFYLTTNMVLIFFSVLLVKEVAHSPDG